LVHLFKVYYQLEPERELLKKALQIQKKIHLNKMLNKLFLKTIQF